MVWGTVVVVGDLYGVLQTNLGPISSLLRRVLIHVAQFRNGYVWHDEKVLSRPSRGTVSPLGRLSET